MCVAQIFVHFTVYKLLFVEICRQPAVCADMLTFEKYQNCLLIFCNHRFPLYFKYRYIYKSEIFFQINILYFLFFLFINTAVQIFLLNNTLEK